MMKIAILDSQKAYLPEIDAYIEYLNKKGIETDRITNQDLDNLNQFDVLWRFSGIDLSRNKELCVVHEYNSLSIGSLRFVKDTLKKHLNTRPSGRVFLNSEVRKSFNFKDGVPSINRDMGISKNFFIHNDEKEYDFVYVGTMDQSRQLENILQAFRSNIIDKKILMVGRPNDELYKTFKNNENIIFTGSVAYEEVPKLASKAVYGVNYIPDIYPYNEQTSTKLLEYCALGLKVITTNYKWVNQFEQNTNSNFFKLNKDLSNFTNENLDCFNFNIPNVEQYEWENLLDEIQLLQFIESLKK